MASTNQGNIKRRLVAFKMLSAWRTKVLSHVVCFFYFCSSSFADFLHCLCPCESIAFLPLPPALPEQVVKQGMTTDIAMRA